jgi:hypothetical protein
MTSIHALVRLDLRSFHVSSAGAIPFIETSEEAPAAREVTRWLRSYGGTGDSCDSGRASQGAINSQWLITMSTTARCFCDAQRFLIVESAVG